MDSLLGRISSRRSAPLPSEISLKGGLDGASVSLHLGWAGWSTRRVPACTSMRRHTPRWGRLPQADLLGIPAGRRPSFTNGAALSPRPSPRIGEIDESLEVQPCSQLVLGMQSDAHHAQPGGGSARRPCARARHQHAGSQPMQDHAHPLNASPHPCRRRWQSARTPRRTPSAPSLRLRTV